jgi:hypothetical protein
MSGSNLIKTSITKLDGTAANEKTREKVIAWIRNNEPEISVANIKGIYVNGDNVLIQYTEGSTGTTTSPKPAPQ